MPLTDELGNQAVKFLNAEGRFDASRLVFGGELTFESWLSLLSEDQPHLSEAENRENAALFARLRDAVAKGLMEAQFGVLARPAPGWLYEFISALHLAQATVITLNYDTLIESGVTSHSLWDVFNQRSVEALDVLENLPPLPAVGARLVGPLSQTFRLLKLHGSLDWWAVPGDLSGATLNREESSSEFGAPSELTDEGRRRTLPGRERFIIPPLSTKSTYYRNPLTRELWHQAHQSLQAASRISVVGYSLPAADLVMASMLRAAVTGRHVSVDIVDPNPASIAERLLGYGLPQEQVRLVAGDNCVEEFALSLCSEASAALADDLRERLLDESPDAAAAVAWGDSHSVGPTVRRVLEATVRDGTTLELLIEDSVPPQGATSARRSSDGTPSTHRFSSVADLAAAIDNCTRVVARDIAGAHTLVSARFEGRNVGANARWLMFTPADRGPSPDPDTTGTAT